MLGFKNIDRGRKLYCLARALGRSSGLFTLQPTGEREARLKLLPKLCDKFNIYDFSDHYSDSIVYKCSSCIGGGMNHQCMTMTTSVWLVGSSKKKPIRKKWPSRWRRSWRRWAGKSGASSPRSLEYTQYELYGTPYMGRWWKFKGKQETETSRTQKSKGQMSRV